MREQDRAELAVEEAEAALQALEDELADPAAWATKYEAAKSEARHTAAKRAVEAAYERLETLVDVKEQAPGLSDLNDEYPGACQPTLVSVGLGPNGHTQYSVKPPRVVKTLDNLLQDHSGRLRICLPHFAAVSLGLPRRQPN